MRDSTPPGCSSLSTRSADDTLPCRILSAKLRALFSCLRLFSEGLDSFFWMALASFRSSYSLLSCHRSTLLVTTFTFSPVLVFLKEEFRQQKEDFQHKRCNGCVLDIVMEDNHLFYNFGGGCTFWWLKDIIYRPPNYFIVRVVHPLLLLLPSSSYTYASISSSSSFFFYTLFLLFLLLLHQTCTY